MAPVDQAAQPRLLRGGRRAEQPRYGLGPGGPATRRQPGRRSARTPRAPRAPRGSGRSAARGASAGRASPARSGAAAATPPRYAVTTAVSATDTRPSSSAIAATLALRDRVAATVAEVATTSASSTLTSCPTPPTTAGSTTGGRDGTAGGEDVRTPVWTPPPQRPSERPRLRIGRRTIEQEIVDYCAHPAGHQVPDVAAGMPVDLPAPALVQPLGRVHRRHPVAERSDHQAAVGTRSAAPAPSGRRPRRPPAPVRSGAVRRASGRDRRSWRCGGRSSRARPASARWRRPRRPGRRGRRSALRPARPATSRPPPPTGGSCSPIQPITERTSETARIMVAMLPSRSKPGQECPRSRRGPWCGSTGRATLRPSSWCRCLTRNANRSSTRPCSAPWIHTTHGRGGPS